MLDFSEQLENLYPNTRWYGPYQGEYGRKYVVCRETDGSKVLKRGKSFSMAYARARMQAILSRKLTKEEEVDHVDGDCTNDRDSNLQVLATEDHKEKSSSENSRRSSKRTVERCPKCGEEFECRPSRKRAAVEKGRKPCCSRSCSSSFYHG